MDVPEATIMVLEQAERFGLAQLHQLRGRVGRGPEQSYCILVHSDGIGKETRQRLRYLRDTDNGFDIAETDFHLRGAGEMLGTRQSGEALYKLASPEHLSQLLETARKNAEYDLEKHPTLDGSRGEAIKLLLSLFERAAAIRTLRAG